VKFQGQHDNVMSANNMQLAYSTNAFTKTDLVSALDSIAAIGFRGAEILCDKPHWFVSDLAEHEIAAVAALLADRGLAVSNLNANTTNGYWHPAPPENVFEPSLCNPDPVLRQWRQQYTIDTIQLASRLGAACVSVTSGNARPGCPPDNCLELLVDSLLRICDAAARHGIKVGIEYEPGLLLECATEVHEVLERVGSPDLGVNFDIGHSYVYGENPEQAIALLKDRIWNVHVEDIKNRKHYHLVPGDGNLPFSRYIDALRANGYQGFLTVEVYTFPDQAVEVGRRSLDYLAKLLQFRS